MAALKPPLANSMHQLLASGILLTLRLLIATAQSIKDNGENAVSDIYPIQAGSQCFHVKGVPKLKLHCPASQLIKVHQAFYGAPPDNKTCHYSGRENHCVQLTDLHENCMGRYMCSVYISNPYLIHCNVYANYMQVNYSCVPKFQSHSMCESITLTANKGYIRTPNYPDSNYTANLDCACRLKTQDPSILLQILDFSLNHTRLGVCESDYLEIASWGKKCGHIGPERLPELLELDKKDLLLRFRTDERYQARGFWMEFSGSGGGKVTMTCGQVQEDPHFANVIPPGDLLNFDTGQIDYVTEEYHNNNNDILIDDSGAYPTATSPPDDSEGSDAFDTYDFTDRQASFAYNIDAVQIVTGCVVGVLILIAVIIIIVLVFRR